MNVVVLNGVLSSAPSVRELPSGSIVHTLEVTTRDQAGATASVPVAWFDPASPPSFGAGDEVVVVGAVRRRFFRTGAATQSRTEVVATAVVAASRRRDVRRAIERAVATITTPAA